MAVYFTVLPDEAEKFYKEALVNDEVEEKRQDALSKRVIRCVHKMGKNELQQALLEVLFDGPEWQYERFIRENGLEEKWE